MRLGCVITSHGEDELFPAAVERLRAEADRVIAIENLKGHNEGVADIVNPLPSSNSENINQGYRRLVSCEIVVICNADIIVPAGWRVPLEAAFADPRIGAAALPMNSPAKRPGLCSSTFLVFTAIRRSAVTWGELADERMVNDADDVMLSWNLYSRGWKQIIVNGPLLVHRTRRTPLRRAGLAQDGESYRSGQPTPRSGAAAFIDTFEDRAEGVRMFELMLEEEHNG